MSEPSFQVRKHSARIQISRDYAIDYGLIEPTEEERRAREQAHEEFLQRKTSALAVAEVLGITVPPDLDLAVRP